MANTYLSMAGTGDAKKWTFSGWFKKCLNGSEQRLITSSDNSTYDDYIRFNSDDTISIGYRNAVVIKTNRKFIDSSGYYNIVVKVDTDQVTVNNRIVLYVNGIDERVNGYSTDDLPGQGLTGYLNYNVTYIGVTNPTANSHHFNGIMSYINFTDAYAYDASAFGSTDSTTGEWQINTSPSVTYGNNGFFILKNGNTITDQSGEGNNFTLGGGTLTNTLDCPDNVFATMNPLDNYYAGGTFTHGNNTVEHGSSSWTFNTSTLKIPENTKFYFEAKVITMNQCTIGIQKYISTGTGNYLGETNGVGFRGNQGNVYKNGSDAGGTFATYTANDIISVACDTINNRIFFGKNGTWLNSGDPTSSTGAITIDDNTDYFFALGDNTSGARGKWSANFGNGYFGTTAVSSAGTNASGIGIFEYDVPANFTALSTKGLNL